MQDGGAGPSGSSCSCAVGSYNRWSDARRFMTGRPELANRQVVTRTKGAAITTTGIGPRRPSVACSTYNARRLKSSAMLNSIDRPTRAAMVFLIITASPMTGSRIRRVRGSAVVYYICFCMYLSPLPFTFGMETYNCTPFYCS